MYDTEGIPIPEGAKPGEHLAWLDAYTEGRCVCPFSVGGVHPDCPEHGGQVAA